MNVGIKSILFMGQIIHFRHVKEYNKKVFVLEKLVHILKKNYYKRKNYKGD
jgi:hypothetical protein